MTIATLPHRSVYLLAKTYTEFPSVSTICFDRTELCCVSLLAHL